MKDAAASLVWHDVSWRVIYVSPLTNEHGVIFQKALKFINSAVSKSICHSVELLWFTGPGERTDP